MQKFQISHFFLNLDKTMLIKGLFKEGRFFFFFSTIWVVLERFLPMGKKLAL